MFGDPVFSVASFRWLIVGCSTVWLRALQKNSVAVVVIIVVITIIIVTVVVVSRGATSVSSMRRSFFAVPSSLDVQHPHLLLSSPIVGERCVTRNVIGTSNLGSCQHRRSIRHYSRPSTRFRSVSQTPNQPAIECAFFHCYVRRFESYTKYGEPLHR